MRKVGKALIESPKSRALAARMRLVWTQWNEWYLNIRTLPALHPDGHLHRQLPADARGEARFDDGVWYESPDYWYLWKIAWILNQQRSDDDVFVDIGAGKGRVICVMARWRYKRVVGIELSEMLCAAACRNADLLRGRKARVDIICGDASRVDMTNGTIYFMYNPFGADTMCAVLKNIRRSLDDAPRDITIVYYNAIHEALFVACKWLQCTCTFETVTNRKVSFWRHIHQGRPDSAPFETTSLSKPN